MMTVFPKILLSMMTTAAACVIFAAGVVFVVMMTAILNGIILKSSHKVFFNSVADIALNARDELYSETGECVSRALAYSAADNKVNVVILEQLGKRSVSFADNGEDMVIDHLALLYIEDGKFLGFAKVTENLSG